MNCLDFVVAAFCVVEIFWLLSADSSDVNFDFFRLMRVVKLTKALRMCLGRMQPALLYTTFKFQLTERGRDSAKFNDTIHTPGDTRDQSLSPVTLKQTFLCDVKPWSSLEPMPFGIVAFSNAS